MGRQKGKTIAALVALLLLATVPALTGTTQLLTIQGGLSGSEVPADSVHYVENALPITVHIIAGMLFGLLGPFQFVQGIRRRHPQWHRWTGRIFVASGAIAAIAALWMNHYFPSFGGVAKYTSNMFFSIGLLFALGVALRAVMRGDIHSHRAWMMRAYAIGLGVATQRLLLMPYFFAFGIPEGETLGLLLWACWLLNLAVAEWVIRGERGRRGAAGALRHELGARIVKHAPLV